jgi:hypothetical protein
LVLTSGYWVQLVVDDEVLLLLAVIIILYLGWDKG